MTQLIKVTDEAVPVGTEVERLIAGATDALTDDMVNRLGATLGDGLDLIDRVNRSGVGDALPTLAAMVKNGDLQRLADVARVVGAAEDSVTDDIIGRVSEAAVGGLDILDRVNRSGVVRALPAITQLVENGDLDRLVSLARLIGSIEDSLSDDIVNRVATVGTELASIVDKIARNDGLMKLIDILSRDEVQCGLVNLAEAACTAQKEMADLPPARGGLGGLLGLAKDPGTQEALRFVGLVTKKLRKA